MWRQASTSERRLRRLARCAAALAACAALAPPLAALELLGAAEALRGAFGPSAAAARRTSFLDDAQLAAVESLAGERPASKIVTWYEVRDADGRLLGRAWLDTHLVRTLQETLLISVDRDGRVRRVDVLAFREPREYLPKDAWLAQLEGRELDDELRLRRGVRVLAGATLSSRSITAATRRALALDRVVGQGGAGR